MSAVHALKDRVSSYAERLALVLCGALLAALLFVLHVEAQKSAPTERAVAQVAQTQCKTIIRHEPCLAPIQSLYAYAGDGSGDTTYIKAKAGKQKVVGEVYESKPNPGTWQVTKRVFAWHSVPGIKIVAVYVVHGGFTKPFVYQRVRSGPHSGHTTLTAVAEQLTPALLLEGRRTG